MVTRHEENKVFQLKFIYLLFFIQQCALPLFTLLRPSEHHVN